jgi:hypothetical protein
MSHGVLFWIQKCFDIFGLGSAVDGNTIPKEGWKLMK